MTTLQPAETRYDWIAGLIAGNPRAQSIAYRKLSPIMFSVCLSYAGNIEDAEDIMQAGFYKMFTRIHTYNGYGNFEGWVRRIMINTALDYLRTKRRVQHIDFTEVEDEAPAISSLFEDKAEAQFIDHCLNHLPENYRQTFKLYAVEGYSHKEVAGITGLTEQHSRVNVLRARNHLKRRFAQVFGAN